MSRAASSNAQLAVQNPQNAILTELYDHPDYREVATFVLGWVFLYSTYKALTSALLRDALRRGFSACQRKPLRNSTWDLEAPTNASESSNTAALSQRHADDGASTFIINLCFIFASSAEFCSLLSLGGEDGGTVACTFVVAWASMASQTARLTGLLVLSWTLKQLGVKRWETYMSWFGSFVLLVLVFALNGIATGTTVVVTGPSGESVCYRKYYLPIALSLSGTAMILELYVIVRFLTLKITGSSRVQENFDRLTDIDLTRAISLLVYDALILVPNAIYLTTLGKYIPFSLGALLVIAAFNRKSAIQRDITYPRRPSDFEEPKFVQTPDALMTPTPFVLNFLDNPISPSRNGGRTGGTEESPYGQANLPISHSDVIEISRDADLGSVIFEVPLNSADPGSPSEVPARQIGRILPFQAKFAEQFEKEELAPYASGPVVRPIHQRPKVFVAIQDQQQQPPRSRESHSTILGSDIIRITPHTPRKKDRSSKLRFSTMSHPPYSATTSPRDSALHSSLSSSVWPSFIRSRSDDAMSDSYDRHISAISREGSTRPYSWRFLSRRSDMSTRIQAKDDLSPVTESSSVGNPRHSPAPSSIRIKTKRTTFGQPVRPEKTASSRSRESFAPPTPLPAALLSPFSPHDMIPPVPPLPPPSTHISALSVTSPGAGRETIPMVGSGNVRGPRLPPIAITSPIQPGFQEQEPVEDYQSLPAEQTAARGRSST